MSAAGLAPSPIAALAARDRRPGRSMTSEGSSHFDLDPWGTCLYERPRNQIPGTGSILSLGIYQVSVCPGCGTMPITLTWHVVFVYGSAGPLSRGNLRYFFRLLKRDYQESFGKAVTEKERILAPLKSAFRRLLDSQRGLMGQYVLRRAISVHGARLPLAFLFRTAMIRHSTGSKASGPCARITHVYQEWLYEGSAICRAHSTRSIESSTRFR